MHELDNPFWSSLESIHRPIALRAGAAARYPAAFAPFLGVAESGADVADALAQLVSPGEEVYLIGAMPQVPPGWTLQRFEPLAQMVREAPIEVPGDAPDDVSILALSEAHRADVLELTALVYPHYFRARTMDLGRYFGIYEDGRLAAMIGERLGTAAARELSAICTHPDFLGRGLARRLTAMLANDTLARGALPFLHVSHANARAKALYERLGFRLRADVPFAALRRGA